MTKKQSNRIRLSGTASGVAYALQRGMWLESKASFSDKRMELNEHVTVTKNGKVSISVRTVYNISPSVIKNLIDCGVIARAYRDNGMPSRIFWLTDHGKSLQFDAN